MKTAITVVSHPFASNGMGEQGRAGLRSLLSVGEHPKVYDLYRYAARKDSDYRSLVLPRETATLPDGIRIFHINGDEVEKALQALNDKGFRFESGYNIIMPAWELPTYPKIWKPSLERFNEVWAISKFVQSSLRQSGLQSYHIGQSVHVDSNAALPRKYFNIRESAFVLLNFFDTASFSARKNPGAVVRLYKSFRAKRPFDDVQLVLKVRSGDGDAPDVEKSLSDELPKDVVVMSENFDSYTTRSLVCACDCLVSLHRSEGFGRGMAEAMASNRLALATGWSGNCDYMSPDNSLFVSSILIDVEEDQYPHAAGQQWAEPDQDHALYLLLRAIDDPSWSRQIRRQGRLDVISRAGDRGVGVRALDRLIAIERANF